MKPSKPTPDFPLFPHASGKWAKKIGGRLYYFGTWDDPNGALKEYEQRVAVSAQPVKARPEKPHPDFPLYPHGNGQWAKRIRGRIHYFGPWTDPQGSLDRYLRDKDALYAGRPRTPEGVTLRYLINRFGEAKQRAADRGEISQRTVNDYRDALRRLARAIDPDRTVEGLTPSDFEVIRENLAKGRGATSLAEDITRIRVLFKYAADQELIARPVRYGQSFKKPSRAALRKAKAARGPVFFEAAEIRAMLKKADPELKAMILVGINCGFLSASASRRATSSRCRRSASALSRISWRCSAVGSISQFS